MIGVISAHARLHIPDRRGPRGPGRSTRPAAARPRRGRAARRCRARGRAVPQKSTAAAVGSGHNLHVAALSGVLARPPQVPRAPPRPARSDGTGTWLRSVRSTSRPPSVTRPGNDGAHSASASARNGEANELGHQAVRVRCPEDRVRYRRHHEHRGWVGRGASGVSAVLKAPSELVHGAGDWLGDRSCPMPLQPTTNLRGVGSFRHPLARTSPRPPT